ncbi:MAG: Ribosome recycling factor [Candidatus Falkowbacteria bacterium GW2011_GWC2_38_22]|uniref:Ribosome-recycling factor n=1 Tax=Candidatus Falkowbacteria bacterium GW2011_GWE1_38_31 TaxID=1618638 RepID=A0A0G0M9L8_9BACT|nr:MAG: Ribosome recycling factor [Candidatus Falkowbacteria bacterium GW2011_GWF2_38_1205]KKQ61507.1 MAG: Ribosome recycling factor [Candidatus Falkowbacteria bacterium GW2011_GWC2_38_22]KKQ63600.1 MAG: Ribosome recycling factor [Candidatus Falkowbacteria bacterium GW2011_GWF1_38_22]KKQ65752.1 MAG: Ribosome recycling factor [Candidatus Falkowbacteria bacterium GW2011_GWE2_38_254]KKQ70369.1 MAG: Ribosome recycling factor [Candidatus Falkowbacteria bacterium GW2011_GWE1_38_31]KKQ72874.1 MAG: Ri
MNTYIENQKEDFNKTIEHFKKEISSLRTGRANPGILDNVQVSAYGVKTPLNGVASINVPDGHSITIAPWDRNVIKDIEKAIVEADLGVGVVNEGMQIRVNVPKMTEENRRDLVKKLNEKQEAARIAIRQIREDIKSEIEDAEKNKEIGEDEKFKYLKELDDEVARQNDGLKAIREKKEEEIMTI